MLVIINIGILIQISREKTKNEDRESILRNQVFALEDKAKQANASLLEQWTSKEEELLTGLDEQKKKAIHAFVAQLLNSSEEREVTPTNADKPARFF